MANNPFDHVLKAINNVFGITCTYTYLSGATPTVFKAVLDKAHVETNGVNSLRYILRISLADLTEAPKEGDSILIDSNTYFVTEVQADAFGGATLLLHVG